MHYAYQCDQLTLLYLSVPLLVYFNKLQILQKSLLTVCLSFPTFECGLSGDTCIYLACIHLILRMIGIKLCTNIRDQILINLSLAYNNGVHIFTLIGGRVSDITAFSVI